MNDMNVINDRIVTAELPVMESGEMLTVDDNTVMHNKRLIFSCQLTDGFDGSAVLKLGHGGDCYAASWLELTSECITVHHKYVEVTTPMSEPHGLAVGGYLTVIIDVGFGSASITLSTAGGIYHREGVAWAGRNGKVFARVEGARLEGVRASWCCDDYGKAIYAFGDSYFNTGGSARWPYYLHGAGYDNCFMTGYPGMRCGRGIVDFRLAITRGKPIYAVWCLGMNNGDSADAVNPEWLETTTEFINTCRERGIIPVICTIPSTPTVNNDHKNRWVRNSGCRFIDMETAVGAHKDKNWYEGMLHEDKVHPNPLGAQALYARVISDFPEITVSL